MSYNGQAELQFSQDHKLELFLDIDHNENILSLSFKSSLAELEIHFEELKKNVVGRNIHSLPNLPTDVFYPKSFIDPISTLFFQAIDNYTGREISKINIRPKEKMICQCFGLSEKEILQQLNSRVDLGLIKDELKASTDCGSCTKGIERMLSNDDFCRISLSKEKELCTCFHYSFKYLASYIYAQKTFEAQTKKKPVLAGTACDFCHSDLEELSAAKSEVTLLRDYGNKEFTDMIFLIEVLLEEYSINNGEDLLELVSFNNFVLKLEGNFEQEKLKKYFKERTGYFFLLS